MLVSNGIRSPQAASIPQVADPELTDYFDPRGAILQLSEDDQPVPTTYNSVLLAAELCWY